MQVDHFACKFNCVKDALNVKLLENKFLQLGEFTSSSATCGRKLEHAIFPAHGHDDTSVGFSNCGHPVEKGLAAQYIIEDVHDLNAERFR